MISENTTLGQTKNRFWPGYLAAWRQAMVVMIKAPGEAADTGEAWNGADFAGREGRPEDGGRVLGQGSGLALSWNVTSDNLRIIVLLALPWPLVAPSSSTPW
jgi:hypothetical protein